jgi:hypothetical protein
MDTDEIRVSADTIEFSHALVGFLRLPANAAKLRSLVDRTLNVAGAGQSQYEVFEDAVRVYSIVNRSGADGLTSRNNACGVFVTIVVRRHGSNDDLLFCPYAFVSDHDLLTLLRERYGYPAWWAKIQVHYVGDHFKVRVATKVYEKGSSTWALRVIFDVDCEIPVIDPWEEKREAVKTILLMQIREAAHPDLARVRQPVDAEIQSSQVRRRDRKKGAVKGAVTVKGGFRSLDLIEDLGLQVNYTLSSKNSYLQVFDANPLTFHVPSVGNHDSGDAGRFPAFVEPRVDPRTPPPYAFDDIVVEGFKFAADPDRLQLIVDALLNNRRGEPRQNFRYRVATAEVIIEYLEYKKMRSTASETQCRTRDDYSRQYELVVRLLVGKTEEDSATATEPRVFCPILFVDNWASMVSGREMMGLWKRMAVFDPPILESNDPGPDKVSLKVKQANRLEAVLEIEYPFQPESATESTSLKDLRGSDARGVFPWVQEDFSGSTEFRSNFARDWMKVSGEKFFTVQRVWLPRPGDAPYRQWVEAEYSIRGFKIAQPAGSASLTFGQFFDLELAKLLTTDTELGNLSNDESGIQADGTISLARLLGLGDVQTITVQGAGWYEATGSFEARVLDRYA